MSEEEADGETRTKEAWRLRLIIHEQSKEKRERENNKICWGTGGTELERRMA